MIFLFLSVWARNTTVRELHELWTISHISQTSWKKKEKLFKSQLQFLVQLWDWMLTNSTDARIKQLDRIND